MKDGAAFNQIYFEHFLARRLAARNAFGTTNRALVEIDCLAKVPS